MTDVSPPTCEWLTKIDLELRLLLGHTTFLPFSVLNLPYANSDQGHSPSAKHTKRTRIYEKIFS